MEIMDREFEIIENKDLSEDHENAYTIISKSEDVDMYDLNNVVSIIDQNTGKEVIYTYNKFIEMLDSTGLESFI